MRQPQPLPRQREVLNHPHPRHIRRLEGSVRGGFVQPLFLVETEETKSQQVATGRAPCPRPGRQRQRHRDSAAGKGPPLARRKSPSGASEKGLGKAPAPDEGLLHSSALPFPWAGSLVGVAGSWQPRRACQEPGPQAETLLPRCVAALGKQSHGGDGPFSARYWSLPALARAAALDARPASRGVDLAGPAAPSAGPGLAKALPVLPGFSL